MRGRLSILMVATEAHPFAKVGGLADVLGALPRALAGLGHDVRIALPYYKIIRSKKVKTTKVRGAQGLAVPIGESSKPASIRAATLPGSPVQVLLVENDDLFGRDGIYTDPATGKDYTDNAERFVFFSRAVLKAVEAMAWHPDVIHCHDYQSGFIPGWLKTSLASADPFKDAGTVYTIHNLAYQGIYASEVGLMAGFGDELLRPMGPLEFYGKVNMMKAGIVFSDTITTVSPTYSREIQTPELGSGLDGVLRSRSSDVVGILNGADYEVWDPAIDSLIPARYSSENLEGKAACKQNLVEHLGLKADPATPLVGIVSRMVDQKGFDIVMDAMDALMGLGVALAVLGTGERKYQDALGAYAKRFPGRVAVTIGFSEELAHLIEAGSDMFLMPSKYEPCGLNQMYSMRYGTVPVVRKTGGLADSVKDFDEGPSATGFVFADYSARALVAAMERAVRVFASKERWRALMLRAMAQDFSWQRSAAAYQQVYGGMLERKRVVSAS
jgi:starch synthase